MGKIKVRILGDEELEKKQKEKARRASEAKRALLEAKRAKKKAGGQRIVVVGPSEEELARLDSARQAKLETSNVSQVPQVPKGEMEAPKKKKLEKKKKQGRSKKYQTAARLIDKTKTYPLTEALKLLEQVHLADFDETVELHVNVAETAISGTTTLPHGSGKEIRVAIASDQLIDNVQKGKIDFDVLLATPQMMPKLARIARFLGPRGLMPNPKSKTITNDPEKLAKSFQKGQINFKTEAKAPIIHLRVGKLSFGEKKLSENIKTIIDALKKEKIKNITLKSTMSPGIKIVI